MAWDEGDFQGKVWCIFIDKKQDEYNALFLSLNKRGFKKLLPFAKIES